MSDLLSQEEIDALLHGVDDVEVWEGEEPLEINPNHDDYIFIDLQNIKLDESLDIDKNSSDLNLDYLFDLISLVDKFDPSSDKSLLLIEFYNKSVGLLKSFSQLKELKINHFLFEKSIELVVQSLFTLVNNLRLESKVANSIEYVTECHKLFCSIVGSAHKVSLNLLEAKAALYLDLGQYNKSLVLMLRCYKARLENENENENINWTQFHLADIYLTMGALKKALLLYKKCLDSHMNTIGEVSNAENLIFRNSLGYCHLKLDNVNDAIEYFSECCTKSIKQNGNTHEDTLLYSSNLIKCYEKQGNVKEALDLYKNHYILCTEELGDDHELSCISKLNLAQCYYKIGKIGDAIIHFNDCYFLSLKLFGYQGDWFLKNMEGLANCYHAQGNFEKASGFYETCYRESFEKYGASHLDTIKSLMRLVNYYDEYISIKQTSTLIINFEQIFKSLINSLAQVTERNRNWVEYVVSCFSILSKRLHLFDLELRDISFSKISQNFQEELDLVEGDMRKRLIEPFISIHSIWLSLAINYIPEHIPTILAAVQGRDMAALMLSELEEKESSFTDDDPRKQYLSVIKQLRVLKLELQLLQGGQDGSEGPEGSGNRSFIERDGFSALNPEAEQQKRDYQKALYDEKIIVFEQLMEQKKQLEESVAEIYPDFALTRQHLITTPEKLSEQCENNEAIVLFFDVKEVNTEAPTKDDKKINGLPLQLYVCVIHQRQVKQVTPVKLNTSTENINCYQAYHSKLYRGNRGGLRDFTQVSGESIDLTDINLTGVASTDIPSLLCEQLDSLDEQIKKHFWQPLQTLLPEVTQWHVVSHGSELHSLPLHNTVPDNHQVNNYPGILFFYQRHHHKDVAPERSIKPTGIAVHHDDAIGTQRPIPFVQVEMSIIKMLTQSESVTTSNETQKLWQHEEAQFFDNWHFSCHGQVNNQTPAQTLLVLDAKQNQTLGMSQLMGSQQRPRVVVLSACVVGQVHHMEGEPIGVNAGFQLRGSDYVIAPTQPVSDFYMPLFMALFYQAWIKFENPEKALVDAKYRLSTGQWYDNTKDIISKAYVPVITELLKEKVLQGDPLKVAEGWFLSQDLQQRFSKLQGKDYKRLEQDSYRKTLSQEIVEHMIDQRANLPEHETRHLCTWIKSFGQVRDKTA